MGDWLDYGEPFDIAPPRPTQWYEYVDSFLLTKLNILQFYGTCYKVMYRKSASQLSQEEKENTKYYINKATGLFAQHRGLIDFNIFKPESVTVLELRMIFKLFADKSFKERKEIYLEQKVNGTVNYILKFDDSFKWSYQQAQEEEEAEDQLGVF